MAGQIHIMINQIIEKRSKGNKSIADITQAKLVLKGVNPANYNSESPDDKEVIEKLKTIAKDLKVVL